LPLRAGELHTERLVLRPWRESDREPFARLNADPEVMRYFPAPLTRAQSDQLAARAGSHIVEHGWGLWAVEVIGGPEFIGFVGLSRPAFTAHFAPAVEVGWRLARPHWGNGYATEAAIASLRFGFEQLELPEIVSFTSAVNRRSRAVMARIGMSRRPADDFAHPDVPPGPLQPHVLYRASRDGRQLHAAGRP
jgi:RimJ/RimL family protein N-acetyltransferase